MKILFAILLVTIPISWDLLIGRIFWKKKTVVAHMLTTSVRLLIMAGLSYLNPSVEFWQSMLLSVSVHYFVFPILYNRFNNPKGVGLCGNDCLAGPGRKLAKKKDRYFRSDYFEGNVFSFRNTALR